GGVGGGARAVQAVVLGGRGDTMVPLPRYCSVGGVPRRKLMDEPTIAKISKRTQDAGGEVVALLKTGSAFVSPAEGSIEMAEAVLGDQRRVLPCAAYLNGEDGHKGIYFGVPVGVGSHGGRRVLELELDAGEKALLDKSAEAVKALIAAAKL